MPYDKRSFLAGIAIGRQLKGWATGGSGGEPTPPGPTPPEPLPSEYQRLLFIIGTGTQYFDSGVSATETLTTYIKYQFTEKKASWGVLLGARSSGDTQRYHPVYIPDVVTTEYHAMGSLTRTYTYPVNAVHELIFNDADHNIIKDGDIIGGLRNSSFEPFPYTLLVFSGGSNGSSTWPVAGTMYYLKFIDSATGDVVRNYIPAQRLSNNKVGMYDTVTATFYTSKVGDFVPGPAVI